MDPKIQLAPWARLHQKSPRSLLKEIQNDIISSPIIANPAFGIKKSIYTDFFASSKPLRKFESIMMENVLPFYANTHTSTTSTAKTTTTAVKLSRETIQRCTNAMTTPGHVHQATVIFCGDGSTSGINKVRNVFRLGDEAYWARKANSESLVRQFGNIFPKDNETLNPSTSCTGPCCHTALDPLTSSSLYTRPEPQHRPVVFLSIQEHHSNLLPWRESCADVIVIPENPVTHLLDLEALEHQLILHQHRPLKLGTFSAGSNITGVLNDTVAISELLHKYDAFAFFDYAGVGPYTAIDMNPKPSSDDHTKNLAYKDGVFISTHKFLGGPGSSGILVARLEIFDWIEKHSGTDKNEYIPAAPGGGTVDMVIQGRHKYTNSVVAREEAGTPNILATIRAGLVFQLQEIVNPEWILQKEYKLAKKILGRLTAPEMEKSIHVLGASEQDRVAVFSLTIAVPRLLSQDQKQPLQIHYALLSTLMNDFFGIEMRGGCMCAGPYASKLLKFDAAKESAFWKLLLGEDKETPKNLYRDNIHQKNLCSKSLKPGFVRFSFSYFAKDKDVDFVIQSLEWMAQYGYLLVPLYKLDADSGEWSLREAVRKFVISEIPSKRMTSGQRKHCIPVAVQCINGLQKLFQEQSKLERQQVKNGMYGSINHTPEVTNDSCPDVSNDSCPEVSNDCHPEVPTNCHQEVVESRFSPVIRQARNSFARLSGIFSQIKFAQDQVHPRVPDTVDQIPDSCSDTSSINSDTNEHQAMESTQSQSAPNISSPSSASITTLNSPDPENNLNRRSSIFSTILPSGVKNQQKILEDALNELSANLLEDEIRAVETSKLAKELRWFVSPLEVAQLYIQELTTPSKASPFPPMDK
ncbi:hypothetical protein BGZ49_002057 [Haplosporangium sp. Z 27]|nr:hypothetical protein BGZ49_002057 [Haplosporangium sp. Z 27]